jgi:hypothetical protein
MDSVRSAASPGTRSVCTYACSKRTLRRRSTQSCKAAYACTSLVDAHAWQHMQLSQHGLYGDDTQHARPLPRCS